jgi:uncharacterized protein YjbJ (UPF0337 family)
MNSDQLKGALKEFAGKAQEEIARLVGSPIPRDRCMDLQYKGRVQVHCGDLKEFGGAELHSIDFPKRRNGWNNGRGSTP